MVIDTPMVAFPFPIQCLSQVIFSHLDKSREIWNDLPREVVGAENLKAFKKVLDRHQPKGPLEAGAIRP